MKTLEQLDHLNLDPAAKTQVAALIQLLLEQAEKDAQTLQAKSPNSSVCRFDEFASVARRKLGRQRLFLTSLW
jgi:hypothetical protein